METQEGSNPRGLKNRIFGLLGIAFGGIATFFLLANWIGEGEPPIEFTVFGAAWLASGIAVLGGAGFFLIGILALAGKVDFQRFFRED